MLRPRALFGAALLGCNPLYLHLSYSFMTDVPYLCLLLSGILAALLGLQRGDDRCSSGARDSPLTTRRALSRR